jgi:hypothetical protein
MATLHATTHTPRVNANWPISFEVTENGKPAPAKLAYEYLLGSAVVAKRPHKPFVGHVSDTLQWPAAATGYPLVFRAVIVSDGKTLYLDYQVKVKR